MNEMQHDVAEHFLDGNHSTFVSELFENDEPMLETARHHHVTFIILYGECKLLKQLVHGIPMTLACTLWCFSS